jgi:uncharacterized membrane protein
MYRCSMKKIIYVILLLFIVTMFSAFETQETDKRYG